jgi:predicted Ser/Thr protein kinase
MSDADSKVATCGRCGAALPGPELEGLCPRCLMALNLSTDASRGGAEAALAKPVRPAPPEPEAIARFFPQLEILECLGRGGMGAVYKARQPLLQRWVALKILAPEKEKEPRFAERFTREAQALARLNHPNIVTVYDFGETNGLYYLLMEFVDGLNLRQLMREHKLAPEQALTIVPPICEALQYAHQQGIVHRDIKPENVLLNKQGGVKIADFGIAKLVGQGADGGLTGVKEIVGTAYYMAPEQVESPQTVDHRADIYSLGVVFYEMLTGELPLGRFAPPSYKAQSDVRLDDVVLRALEKEPARRYQQASEVKSDVETITTQTAQAAAPASLPMNPSPQPPPRPTGRGRRSTDSGFMEPGRRKKAVLLSACGVVGLLLAALALAFLLPRTNDTPRFPWAVAFLPDGKTLVTGGGQRRVNPNPAHGELVFWKLASGRRGHVVPQSWGIRSLASSKDGKFLVVGDANGLTRLVEPYTGKTIVSLMPSAYVNSVAVSADSQLVASGSFDGTISLWDVGRREQETLALPNELVLGVALSPDHSALVATTRFGRAYLFDLVKRGEPRVLPACPIQRNDANAEGAAFSPDGSSFATVCQRSVRLWETASGKLVREWQGSGATFSGVAFAPDGQRLATVNSEGVLALWNSETGESLGNVQAHETVSYAVVFSPDGKRLATTGLGDYAAKLWDAQTLAPVKSFVRATPSQSGNNSPSLTSAK